MENNIFMSQESGPVFQANRLPEALIVTTPEGISLRFGTSDSLPDAMYGRGYREHGVTNETITGLIERAQFAKERNREISSFICVGNPIKTVLQSAILEPSEYLSVVDISGQNTYDAVLILSALRRGYFSVVEYSKTPEGQELLRTLNVTYPDDLRYFKPASDEFSEWILQSERIHKNEDRFFSIDVTLLQTAKEIGIPAEKIIAAIRNVRKIEVHLDSLRSDQVITTALSYASETQGHLVIDASNIPLYSDVLDKTGQNPTIFFGFNALDEVQARYGVRNFGINTNASGTITYWNYPLNDPATRAKGLRGGLTIGMTDYKKRYKIIVDKVDSIGKRW